MVVVVVFIVIAGFLVFTAVALKIDSKSRQSSTGPGSRVLSKVFCNYTVRIQLLQTRTLLKNLKYHRAPKQPTPSHGQRSQATENPLPKNTKALWSKCRRLHSQVLQRRWQVGEHNPRQRLVRSSHITQTKILQV
ncbi:hypothetical protein F5H01DRAFT_342179 [Linnemannia elongata]|nr:hypothetical protein F5H01DRAFT_342179 [Linnemannia elongata]